MIDIRAVFEDEVPAHLARHPELAEQVDAVLQVEVNGASGGVWAIDLTREQRPGRVTAGAHPKPRVRIRFAEADFVELMEGRQRWTDAFVQGRIEVKGDLIAAIKLRKLFAAFAGAA